jgi:hypothetical protein
VIPIFDTNIFTHVQSGLISTNEWLRLWKHRPRHGWRLSFVTAMELLAGLPDISTESFPRLKQRIETAWSLSRGRILEEPRHLLCTKVLRRPFPPDKVAPAAHLLARHMDVVRCARSLAGLRARMRTLDAVKQLAAGPKAEWKTFVEHVATQAYPPWRELFRDTGRRLPSEMRAEFERPSVWEASRPGLVKAPLEWLGAEVTDQSVAEMDKRLDAMLRFIGFVVRLFLTGDYNLDTHHSDVFDGFQLQYLAMDHFVIVSNDQDLHVRTSGSLQASRIMTFSEFLQSL